MGRWSAVECGRDGARAGVCTRTTQIYGERLGKADLGGRGTRHGVPPSTSAPYIRWIGTTAVQPTGTSRRVVASVRGRGPRLPSLLQQLLLHVSLGGWCGRKTALRQMLGADPCVSGGWHLSPGLLPLLCSCAAIICR